MTRVERPLLGVFLVEHREPDQQCFEGESSVGSYHAIHHGSQIRGIIWNEKLINRTAERLLIQSALDLGMVFCSAYDSFCTLPEIDAHVGEWPLWQHMFYLSAFTSATDNVS